jgi:hypothetical protein
MHLHSFVLNTHAPDKEPDGKVDNEDTPVRELCLAGVSLDLFPGVPRCLVLIEHHDPLPQVKQEYLTNGVCRK